MLIFYLCLIFITVEMKFHTEINENIELYSNTLIIFLERKNFISELLQMTFFDVFAIFFKSLSPEAPRNAVSEFRLSRLPS